MNILHVNTFSGGGAFTGTYRLHKALMAGGIQSTILVKNPPKEPATQQVKQYNQSFRKENLFNRISFKLGYPVTALQKRKKILNVKEGEYEIISFPFSNIDITQSKAYQDADIIHLHWVGDFLDYKSFFSKNKKPVVWTLRDMYPLQGIFHVKRDLERNSKDWALLNEKMIAYKKEILDKRNCSLAFVGISNYMTASAKESAGIKANEYLTIPNCIDTSIYEPVNKEEARKRLDIAGDKLVFCFVADYIHAERKGFSELKEAIEQLDSDSIEFLSAGEDVAVFSSNVGHRHLGRLDTESLKLVYAASDAFIFPTKEEALGNVMLEAMACGTPVIGTPVGGLLDVIEEGFNGVFTEGTSAAGIKKGIERFIAIKDSFNSEKIRANIAEKFSPSKIAQQYIDLYNSLLNA